MKNMKKVSVIIPTYNCEKFIAEAIESVLTQTYKNYEIIVIDDGSTDNTKKILKYYTGKIKYIHQENQGVAVARNTGIKSSNGQYIGFLDADDLWFKNKLELQVKILDENNNIDIVHANDVKISHDKKILNGYGRSSTNKDGYLAKKLILRRIQIQIGTVLLRRKCLQKSGLFDPKLSKLGAEDREFFFRLTQNCKAKYIDRNVSYYRIISDSFSSNRENMLKGHRYILDKHFPPNSLQNIFIRKYVLSQLKFEEGKKISWKTKNYNLAIKKYVKALYHFPFNPLIFYNLLKTIIKKILM